jgi:hypothetical protein
MTGERDLATLLRTLRPELTPDIFVFCTMPLDDRLPPDIEPILSFREDEGITVILTLQQAEAARLPFIYPCRKITLKVHSSLEAIGMMASITTRLAEKGISVNPVSGYYHDHLFVPADKADLAMQTLMS